MSTITKKLKPFTTLILSVLILLLYCYEFESIHQPDLADPNSTFSVQITVSSEERDESVIPHFGIMLPTGWTVNDSIQYKGALTGTWIFSSEMTDSLEKAEPAPNGYYWWVSVGDTADSLMDGTVSFTPQIHTDDQSGNFCIDYILGYYSEQDSSLTMIHSRSKNHPISVNAPMTLYVTNTNNSGEGSLRQALNDVSSRGEILFNLTYPATIILDSALVIDRNLAISGPESGQLILSGNNKARVFYFDHLRNVNISNLTITDGNVYDEGNGGGIYCYHSGLNLKNVTITNNTAIHGGGIWCSKSNINFSNVTIAGNTASSFGGGISISDSSTIVFNSELRSSVFNNSAVLGNDLYSKNNSLLNVVLDTFTVLYPSSYYAYPLKDFNFDILNAKIVQYDTDLYVKTDGENSRIGTSWSEAFKNISYAISRILADSLRPHTIFINDGIYSPSTTGEDYPLIIPEYVTLSGNSRENVILNAEQQNVVIKIGSGELSNYQQELTVENLTITGGSAGGILCSGANLNLNNVKVSNNVAERHASGGGIQCSDAKLCLSNVIVSDNQAINGGGSQGGGISINRSRLIINNTIIKNNLTGGRGGGIRIMESDVDLVNVALFGNISTGDDLWFPDMGGAISIEGSNSVSLTNMTIYDNKALYGGAIGLIGNYTTLKLVNCILWGNSPQEIRFSDYGDGNPKSYTLITTHSNIQNGRNGIVTNNDVNEFWLNGNINSNPIFTDPASGDFRLHAGSPCIDAGIQDTMIIYNEGLDTLIIPTLTYLGSAPDMGAFEFDPSTEITEKPDVPKQYTLSQNYPNPFNPTTTIEFDLPKTSEVTLKIYNILGEEVVKLVSDRLTAGSYSYDWDADNIASGVYLYRLEASDFVQTRKMILMR